MSDQEDNRQDNIDLNFHTDMPVGEILRRTRVHYGQSLFQIETILRIRASQLEALEQGDVSRLPGRVYAIGFVRSYSEYLGLDGDKMVHLFKEQSVGRQKKPDLAFPVSASESKVPNIAIIVASLFGVLVLIGFVSFMIFPSAPKNEVPDVPEELTRSQLNQAPALVGDAGPVQAVEGAAATGEGAAASAGEETAPPESTSRIVLQITDSSWVSIINAQGATVLDRVLKPGDMYMVPPEPGLVMATGNAGGIRIKVDGKDLKPLGTTGQVKRRIALNPDALLAGN